MNFEYKVEIDGDIINVSLKGRLTADNVGDFFASMEKLVGSCAKKIVFEASELDYIASAGLRVIIFTKQKIGYEADVIMKNPKPEVVSVIEMTGLDNFVAIE